jgi:hypothetical protein
MDAMYEIAIDSKDWRRHEDDRLCTVKALDSSHRIGRYAKVVASCTCGRTKELFAGEVNGYVSVCNGGVILRYSEDGFFGQPFPKVMKLAL